MCARVVKVVEMMCRRECEGFLRFEHHRKLVPSYPVDETSIDSVTVVYAWLAFFLGCHHLRACTWPRGRFREECSTLSVLSLAHQGGTNTNMDNRIMLMYLWTQPFTLDLRRMGKENVRWSQQMPQMNPSHVRGTPSDFAATPHPTSTPC